jgi:trigger factor
MSLETNDIRITPVAEEPGTATLKVEVPVDRVERAEQQATTFYAKRARLPGFRKGKAPQAVIRKQYRGEIRERMLRELIGESWKQVIDDGALKPIAEPHVHDLKFEDGAPLSFEFKVEVKPELALERLGNFSVKRTVTPVTDDAVAEQIEEMQSQKASWLPVEDAQPTNGQMVSLDIATVEDGAVGEKRPYQIVLGSGNAIPELEEQIMTMTQITLRDVKRQELPALDDAFAGEVGDFDSMDALRQAVRHDLEAHAAREADADVRRQLVDEIITANGLEAPPGMVQRALSAYAQSYGVPDDQLERFTTEFRPVAERQVLRELIIDHVSERESLAATEDDVDARVEEIAARRDTEPGKVYASLQKANQLREIERGITEEKVFAHLLAQSTIDNA